MKTISAILPVYNEAKLIPFCLKRIMPQIDQLVLIDGGPQGPSSDETEDLAREIAGDKLCYLSGMYNQSGRFDRALQIKEGLDAADGDIIMRLSADMLIQGMQYLRDAVDEHDTVLVFDCQFMEFWLDTRHIRLNGNLNPIERRPLAVSREIGLSVFSQGGLDLSRMEESDRIYLLAVANYHLGWIRPFKAQVEKHVSHVYAKAWGEHGDTLMQAGERTVECWAIHHVMRYKNAAYARVDGAGLIVAELEDLDSMAYDEGFDEFRTEYEDRYGEDFFIGISRTISPELIM